MDLTIEHSTENIWNEIHAVTYPVDVDTALSVLSEIPEELQLEPGESRTIYLRYIDAATGQRISGRDLVTPVADTDYTMSSIPGNGGNDLNGSLTVAPPTAGANTMLVTLTNGSATQKGYVNIQVRGYKVTLYDKAESVKFDQTSIDTYGEKTLNFNMPYQSNSAFGEAVAAEILRRYKDPLSQISSVTFIANRSETLMGYALRLEIGVRVNIVETATGVSDAFFINGYEFEMLGGNVLQVTWILERAFNDTRYFLIDDATYGLIDGEYLLAPF
jgi:hypothetical protein